MLRLTRIALIAALGLCLTFGGGTGAAAADDTAAIVENVLEAWSGANVGSRSEELAGMYAPNALFYGSAPDLFAGQAGVLAYFQAVPKGGVKEAVFFDTQSARIAENVIVVGSFVDFHVNFAGAAKVLNYRIMLTLVRGEDGSWMIAGHHAAPRL
ncbi:YybH family protein [Actibacterium sp. D379-3]